MDEFLPGAVVELRAEYVRFLERHILPAVADCEREGRFPREQIRAVGEAGWFGALFPESLGGSDLGFLVAAVLAEEMARLDPALSLCQNQQAGTCPYTVLVGGTDAQCERYIPPLLAGSAIGMWSLTEAGGGSDAAGNLRTRARRDGDVYRISGRKMFATLGDQTDTGVLFARTGPEQDHRGISAFMVEPAGVPGWRAEPIDMVGMPRSMRSCELVLDDFPVPVAQRIGAQGEGFRIAMHAVQAGRVNVAARAVGIARACLEEAIAYASERSVRGTPLARYQLTQGAIAEALVQVEAARLMTYQAATLMDAERPANRVAAQAKLAASYALRQAAGVAAELFGGYAIAAEYRIARLSAFAHVFLVGEGAPAVQKVLIAEHAFGIKDADRHRVRYRHPRDGHHGGGQEAS